MAAAPVILHGAPYSVYVRIVRLALIEKGVDYTQKPVDIFSASEETRGYLSLNPFGKIPTFQHGDFVLYETQAITRYIDEAFDGPALQPDTPEARARMGQVMGIVDSFAYRTMVWDIYVADTARRKGEGAEHGERIENAIPQAIVCLTELNRLLEPGPFFGGSRLSLADLHVAPVFGYFLLVPEAGSLLPGFPGLAAWWARFSARDSWQAVSASTNDRTPG